MGHRLSKIYTRTGDDGSTGLSDRSRISKHSPRMQAIGAIDETNSLIGVLVAELPADDPLASMLTVIQHDLFDLGGELSIPGSAMVAAPRVAWLEEQTDELNAELPPLKNFILPGGSRAAAFCHLARTVCRRAEREMVGLAELEELNVEGRRFLNRLSDLLFVTARAIARRDGGQEVLWQQRKPPA
ncbi:MAG: cob(I)yrinic acid a,c-diamide adenosyltransferase [Gammaproteobacteria bacterium]|jgi:cob(I)alamin adenosyltransferase|nr:cob(I)yrinic acid a,c-diamide adenosyltransferase [Gammaproteobacteria bacterium]MBP6053014.1 cob(I)yrinic acid a,c-diamide adenosyltransferase [Pseudomonadales bacterium]MBK6583527.1 cob(I)yrinic acid a,c-diamide adenosyltransferase [Gammaproteobacteria bacterium]MBK7169524.1 cob(I)yrinic acid a,c-diamide adenosyltransferase [Gammaproteobacteria bacterium]MBK7521865.1 cob(I)yrinic acid a,c-diamide adenosyltransferase [Gammaproteobacteria bacterium]